MLTCDQFARVRKLAMQLAGIALLDRHQELLKRRSGRLGIRDRAGIAALLAAAESGDPQAGRRVIHWVTTRFTGFFRHPAHFDVAAEHALRTARERGQARCWSAAAATGEEPYSLAMALIERFGRTDPPATILATDVDEEGLAVACRGEYGEAALRGLEPERRSRHFDGSGAGPCWRLAQAVRRLVEFRAQNLAQANGGGDGPFDVIFCRNVLIYLEAGIRSAVLERVVSRLAPDGILILDPVEHLGRAAHGFSPGTGGVYRRLNPSPSVRIEPGRGSSRIREPRL